MNLKLRRSCESCGRPFTAVVPQGRPWPSLCSDCTTPPVDRRADRASGSTPC